MKKLLIGTIFASGLLVGCGNQPTVESVTNQFIEEFGNLDEVDVIDAWDFAFDNDIQVINRNENGETIGTSEALGMGILDWKIDEFGSNNSIGFVLIRGEVKEMTSRERVEHWLENEANLPMFIEPRLTTFIRYDNAYHATFALDFTGRSLRSAKDTIDRAMNNLAVQLAEQEFDIQTIQIGTTASNLLVGTVARSSFNRVNTEGYTDRVTINYVTFNDELK